jgi:hypothetical protein
MWLICGFLKLHFYPLFRVLDPEYTLAPDPDTLTPEPATLTPDPGTLTPDPDTLTPEPDSLTADPDILTSDPFTLTPVPCPDHNSTPITCCMFQSTNFCSSAREAFNLIMRNLVRVVVLDRSIKGTAIKENSEKSSVVEPESEPQEPYFFALAEPDLNPDPT